MRTVGEVNPGAALPNNEVVAQICKYSEAGSVKTVCKSLYMDLCI